MEGKGRKVIAVCASWEDVENLNLVLDHLIRATEGTDYLPMCIAFDRSSIESRGEESLREFLSVFEVPNLAGFLLFGEMIRSDNINRHLIRVAHGKGLPVFMLERQYEGCINLSLSYREGFEQMARHIVEYHGCRDVVMVAGINGNAYSEERIGLCRDMLEAHGGALPPERVIYGDFWDEPTTRALDGYFAAGGAMPEAFICANDAMAIAVCIYLAQRNVRVPAQVRVAGFDGILQGGDHEPSITTMRPDYLKMFKTMLDRIGAWRPEEAGNTQILPVPFELIRGESCGCEQANSYETVKKVGQLKMLNLTYTRHISALNAVTGNYRLEQANAAMLEMAEHDYLTGLYNRRGFLRELERRLRLPEAQGLTLSLFAMDMDGLKGINDVYGHHEGDHAIWCMAQAIQEAVEGQGICARYGGDEFAFALLAEASLLPELEAIRTRIEASARKLCDSKAYRVSASIGACASPVQGLTSLGQLLVESDRALYADKLQRKRIRPRAGESGQ